MNSASAIVDVGAGSRPRGERSALFGQSQATGKLARPTGVEVIFDRGLRHAALRSTARRHAENENPNEDSPGVFCTEQPTGRECCRGTDVASLL